MNSFTEENYLKAIYKISEQSEGPVSTTEIARLMDIKSATVTDMLKKLAGKKLIKYEKYKGLFLTEQGRQIGIKIIRKHRLWELFLVEKMNFNWDEVHEIAEQLEHIQSDELINRLDDILGNPQFDPHGDPIPDRFGVFNEHNFIPLSEITGSGKWIVSGIKDNSVDFLRYLDRFSIGMKDELVVQSVEKYDSSVNLLINNEKEVFISHQAAENILVKPAAQPKA